MNNINNNPEQNQKTNTATHLSNILWSLVIVVVMHTCLGVGAAILWAYGTSALNIPAVTLLQFLALWWAWMLFFLPTMGIAVTYFRATDPLVQAMRNGGGVSPFKK